MREAVTGALWIIGICCMAVMKKISPENSRAYEEIAVREGCSYQAVQKSIAAALKKSGNF